MKYLLVIVIAITAYILAEKLNKQATNSLLAEINEFKLEKNRTYKEVFNKINERKYKLLLSKRMRDYVLLIQKIEFFLAGETKLEESILDDYNHLNNKYENDLIANFNLYYYLFYFSLKSSNLKIETRNILYLLKDLSYKINTSESVEYYEKCEKEFGKKDIYE